MAPGSRVVRPLGVRRVLPNFLIIGAMKAGTTSLYSYLKEHPQTHMSTLKEVHFLSDEENWKRGRGWYESHFLDAGDSAVAVGEASTTYTRFPRIEGVPARIAGMLPDVRLIYLVRNPVDRMVSDYLHRLSGGQENDTLETALLTKRKYADIRLAAQCPHDNRPVSARGRYFAESAATVGGPGTRRCESVSWTYHLKYHRLRSPRTAESACIRLAGQKGSGGIG